MLFGMNKLKVQTFGSCKIPSSGAGLRGSFFSIVRGGALVQDDSEIKCEGNWSGEFFIFVGS